MRCCNSIEFVCVCVCLGESIDTPQPLQKKKGLDFIYLFFVYVLSIKTHHASLI